MTASRFDRPGPGVPMAVRFPPITRETLGNGLRLWVLPHAAVPVATVTLLIGRGTGDDPPGRPGLASLAGDLLDEGAGRLDAIALAETFAAMGTELEIDVGPDATALSSTVLTRFFAPMLELVGDVVMRPRMQAEAFQRVRELRLNRLRQLSQSTATIADRAFVEAVFGTHPYGHGALGTTASLETTTRDEARDFWATMFGPREATLIVVGDVDVSEVVAAVTRVFSRWSGPDRTPPRLAAPVATADPRVFLVDRPGAPQAELRIGHLGPSRQTPAYHALVTLNAVLGGQFTSRINRRLREEKGVTYGARTAFDFRRVAGTFSCDSSIDVEATADAVSDVLEEFAQIRQTLVPASELAAARTSLTRGYVRNFETGGQLSRAAVQIATYDLDDDTFDRFVPAVESVTADGVKTTATTFVRPADATIVVVADADRCRSALERVGRPVAAAVPRF